MVYDVAIIGGGPVGSTCASLLSRAGHNVIVLEKEKFPRDHVGESLLPFCKPLFDDLGLTGEMKKRFSRKPGVKFTSIDNSTSSHWCFGHVIHDDSYLSFHVLRSEFDKLLLDHSRTLGAEVREEHMVTAIENNPGQNIKIKYRTKGTTGDVECRFFIDASGQDAFYQTRNNTKLKYNDLHRSAFATHWKNVNYDDALKEGNIQIVYLGGEKKGWIWMIPIESDRISIGVALNSDYVKSRFEYYNSIGVKNVTEQLYLDELFLAAKANEILKDAVRIQPVISISDYSYYSSVQYGENFALLGDAVAFLDPIFSSGIYMGMKSAYVLCNKLSENLKTGKLSEGFDEVYQEINGAYKLIEKFVRLFYSPDRLDMAGLGTSSGMEHLKHENAFSLIHYLLAGDFFSQHARYSDFIDLLEKPEMFMKFKNLVINTHDSEFGCGHRPEEIYPDLLK